MAKAKTKNTNTNSTGWVRDTKAEKVLAELNIDWAISEVPLTAVNFSLSNNNPARSARKLNPDTVDDYAIAMLDGDEFPMLIGYWAKNKTFVVISGVHRVNAAQEANRPFVGAYVISESAMEHTKRLLAVMSNRLEGQRADREEAIAYGVDLIMRDGLMLADVAKQLGLHETALGDRVRSRELQIQAEKAGFRGELVSGVWYTLNTYKDNERLLVAAANLAKRHKLSAASVRDIKKRLQPFKSEAQRIAEIEKIDEELSTDRVTVGPVRLPRRTQFLRGWSILMSLLVREVKYTPLDYLQIEHNSETHKLLQKQAPALIKAIHETLK